MTHPKSLRDWKKKFDKEFYFDMDWFGEYIGLRDEPRDGIARIKNIFWSFIESLYTQAKEEGYKEGIKKVRACIYRQEGSSSPKADVLKWIERALSKD